MDKKSDQNNSASFEDAQDSPARFDDCVDNDQQEDTTDSNKQEKKQSTYVPEDTTAQVFAMEVPDDDDLNSNPYILSREIGVGQSSFADQRQQYQKIAPPPKYFDDQYLMEKFKLPTEKDVILRGMEIPETGGLLCTDEEQLAKQKGVLSHCIKQIAMNMLKGLSISHMSLPIKIFEPRSSVQRICDLFSFAPKFLKQAGKTEDHLERMKLCIAFMVSSMYMCCDQNKPFNPILGETMQGKFEDGSIIYCEHTSHHPPITNFSIEDSEGLYTLSGYFEICGKMGTNNFVSGLRGPCFIDFKDGHHIRFGFPSYKIGGTVMGERTIETIGSCTFEDLTNNRKSVLLCTTFKKTGWITSASEGSKDEIKGIIYDSYELTGDKESMKSNYCKEIKFVEDLSSLKDVKQQICQVNGSWLKSISIDEKKYWDVDEDIPHRQLPVLESDGFGRILASDWRYREDLIWLKYGHPLIAHQWKVRLEVQQRRDRANRQAADKRIGRIRH